MIEVIQAANLKNLPDIRHGFFTRNGGVSTGEFASLNCASSSEDDPEAVRENWRRVAAHLGLASDRLICCNQIHSPDVITVTAPWSPEKRPSADAMVTNVRGIGLGVPTGDCLPLLLADPAAGVIGAAHAGWSGALGGVIENTMKAMEALDARCKNIRAAFGPCIWKYSYEVELKFMAPFLAEDSENKKYFSAETRPGHCLFDLPGYVTGKLQALGIDDIERSPADTFAEPDRFYSYRRDGYPRLNAGGRQLSVIVLAA